MGKIVAIDYGKKRIGLAYADERLKVALPFISIEAKEDVEKTIENLLKELKPFFHEIILFVIGLPLLLSGKEGPMAKEVKKFGELLEKKSKIPICYFDERLTSAEIEKEIKRAKISRKKMAKKKDPLAACRILQDYLSSHQTQQ